MGDDDCECCETKTCGFLLSLFTWAILGFCSSTVLLCLNLELYTQIGYIIIISLAFTSHLMAMFSDPGYTPQGGGEVAWSEQAKALYYGQKEALILENQTREIKLSDKEIVYKSNKGTSSFSKKCGSNLCTGE